MPSWLSKLWRSDPPLDHDHLALDLETTGLDPQRDEILSAGCVPMRDGVIRWGERRYRLVSPIGTRGNEAVAVHGLLPDEVSTSERVAALVEELQELLKDRVLVVHWGGLDVGFLRRVFREQGISWPDPFIVDTAELLARLDRRRRLFDPHPIPVQLAAARRALGLPRHEEHHALYDALATAELYLLLRARLG